MTGPRSGQPPMSRRCLDALEALGGEATSAEVREWIEKDWDCLLTANQVTTPLARMASLSPPLVTRVPGPGGGPMARWRLTEEGSRLCGRYGAGPCSGRD